MQIKTLFRILLIVIFFAGFTLSLGASESASPPAQAKTSDKVKYFFTQTARYATLEKHSDKPDWYSLVLHDIQPETLWFSDRPLRHSGVISIHDFIKQWDQGAMSFAAVNPNANLVAVIDKEGIRTQTQGVFVLSEPQYDEATRNLSYKVFSLHKPFHEAFKSGQLHHVALFIDSSGCIINPFTGKCF